MYTPEEEYIPTENEAHGASPPLSRVLVEIPYSRPIESSHNRPQVQVAETSTGLAATLMSQFRASRIEWDDGMHTQYAIVVESGKDQAAFCPPRVILAGTEKQANLALEANRLARDIAEKTRDMVIAQKSAPLWNETPGHGWRGTREQIRAVGLKA
ncbi:hypothetical protein HY948_04905, partial [Candidatus Gottesmanbacteria bacterium]|nr:hypothetical protein [Candidatus Gottesmanbacteria bacterium]